MSRRYNPITQLRNVAITNGLMIDGTTMSTTADEANTLAGVTAGTITASKAVVVDGAKAVNEWTVTTGVLTQDKTITGTALGTVRGVHGQVVAPTAAIASGTIAGVRGICTLSGTVTAGGAFFYGTQGKLVVTGTMNHADSRMTAGISQLDATGGTLTAGQLSGHWIDIVGITGAGGDQFNLLRMTSNAAAKPNALIYAQSNATYVFDLAHPTGTTTDYLVAAGTSAGSAGKSDGCAAQKVLTILVDGVAHYIPAFNQNT